MELQVYIFGATNNTLHKHFKHINYDYDHTRTDQRYLDFSGN